MGSIGTRRNIATRAKEPKLWAGVDDIVADLKTQGFINGNVVDIERLIKSKGIGVVYDDTLTPSQSGYLRKTNGAWVIGVNKHHHRRRQRFTLAHEFGHFIMHKNDDMVFEDEVLFRDENLTAIEYAANRFAAELLMPQELFVASIKKGETSLEDLAEKFEVSTLAVKNRVLTLGYNLKNAK